MRKSIMIFGAAFLLSSMSSFAQFRSGDKSGINVFETPKTDVPFDGVKVKIGGGFTQSFQTLDHSNTADPKMVAGVNQNELISLVPGFNLASANLALKTQLADGVALNMELYLASRHHNETWVRGGFIQFDKVPFLKSDFIDNIMKYTTLKVGQMEVNYGDAHFRRSDGGNSIYNPFVENYIIDEFATEVGAEVDVQYKGFLVVGALTNGKLKGDIVEVTPVVGATNGKHNPSIIGKVGYDNEVMENLRLRLTGSVYHTAGSVANTLFWGDRTGSHYFGVMDYAAPGTGNAWSGRYNPGLSDKVTALMGNLFVKFHGLEWFSTLESASGRAKAEITGERRMSQFATDLVYRFGNNENFWVGARYNTATSAVAATTPYDVTIDRFSASAGWFVTKNVMAKVEYVNQDYKNFVASDIRNGGNFNGLVIEAVVGF